MRDALRDGEREAKDVEKEAENLASQRNSYEPPEINLESLSAMGYAAKVTAKTKKHFGFYQAQMP